MKHNPNEASWEEAQAAYCKDFEIGDMVAYPFTHENYFCEVIEVIYLRHGYGKCYIIEHKGAHGRRPEIVTQQFLVNDKRNWK